MQKFEHVKTPNQLKAFCRKLEDSTWIAFDTEFVSEKTFHPQLCLVQVASEDQLALLDVMELTSLDPFWSLLVEGDRQAIVHAGRVEMEFCHRAKGKVPQKIFDVQIASAFVGNDYPAGYAALLNRYLNVSLHKHETRSDWRKRPLSQRQIEYALNDVSYLRPLQLELNRQLTEQGRLEWFEEESQHHRKIFEAEEREERWRKVAGSASLSARGLAVLRELHLWRDEEAERMNLPPRFVLRDDLLIELARCGTADVKRIRAIHGLDNRGISSKLDELSSCIARANAMEVEKLPARISRAQVPQLPVLGQFLFAILGSHCRKERIAPMLVATPTDLREWIAYCRQEAESEYLPRLAQGWRKYFLGNLFDAIVQGECAVRIDNVKSESPLELVSLKDKTSKDG